MGYNFLHEETRNVMMSEDLVQEACGRIAKRRSRDSRDGAHDFVQFSRRH